MFFDRLNKGKEVTYDDTKKFSWRSMISNALTNEEYLKESTYLKCINYTANKIASLTFNIKKTDIKEGDIEATTHKNYEKITLRPNRGMNFVNLVRSLVVIGEHEGISCLYIDPDDKSLYPCRVNQIFIDDVGLINTTKGIPVALEIVCNNITQVVAEENCIIYHGGVTTDGISSKAIKDYLELTVKTTMEGQKILSELFANGLTNKAIVQLTSDIKDEKELGRIQAKFGRMFSSTGRIFTVPAGYNVSPLNLSLADSQFKELRGLSRREIASNFGLTPSMIGEDASSSTDYEAENIRYLTDTLLVKIKGLEQEFNFKYLDESDRKRGYKIEINLNVLLRTTAEKQMKIITEYTKQGIYPLEYSRKLLGVPLSNEGIVTLPSGQVLLKDLLEGKATWQKGNSNGSNLEGGD